MKLEDLIFIIVGMIAVPFCILAFVNYMNTPDVVYSYSTKKCIKVVYPDGKETSCEHLPERYNHIWGK
jgi:hypothetical protein